MDIPGTTPEKPDAAATDGCGCGCGTNQDLGQPSVGEPAAEKPQGTSAGEASSDSSSAETATDQESSCCGGHADRHGEEPAQVASESSEDSDESADSDGCGCGCGDKEPEKTVEEQLAETTEQLLRVSAEYSNYRKRTERDRIGIGATAKAAVVADFLPVIDDLELAKQHGDLTGPLKAVNEKLRSAFSKNNVTEFGAAGEEFNPEIHEAVQDTSSGDSKVIGTVLRPGFMLGERVIRHAMVIIADPE